MTSEGRGEEWDKQCVMGDMYYAFSSMCCTSLVCQMDIFSCWIQSLDFRCFSGTQNDEELLSRWVGNSSHDILLLSTLVCSSIQFHFIGLHHFLYSFSNVTQSYINSSFLQLIKKQPWIKKRPNFCKASCNLTRLKTGHCYDVSTPGTSCLKLDQGSALSLFQFHSQ